MANILLIDDDDQFREMLQLLLAQAGHTVATARDGIQGLKLCRATPPDLVMTDIVMPNQEGLETIMQLRREFPNLGIIAMSGGAKFSATWLTVAAHLGANRTLAKPFTIPHLTKVVAETLGAPITLGDEMDLTQR